MLIINHYVTIYHLKCPPSLTIHAGSLSPPDDNSPCRSHPSLAKPPHNKRVVLVTGAAGFVGYHVSRYLIDQWDADVIGLDSFTDYYDVQLKRDRSNELIKAGVILYRGDVCDRVLLSYLFQQYNFTDVVHMAAQAGVRHSLDQPSTYAHTNIQCFLTLLDTLREFKVYFRLCRPPTPPTHTHTPHTRTHTHTFLPLSVLKPVCRLLYLQSRKL